MNKVNYLKTGIIGLSFYLVIAVITIIMGEQNYPDFRAFGIVALLFLFPVFWGIYSYLKTANIIWTMCISFLGNLLVWIIRFDTNSGTIFSYLLEMIGTAFSFSIISVVFALLMKLINFIRNN